PVRSTGEEVRGVPHPLTRLSDQDNQNGCDMIAVTVTSKVQRQQMIALQPRLVTDVAPHRRRPPQATHMPLPLPAKKPAHRTTPLQRNLPRLLERHTTLNPVFSDVADLERHRGRTRRRCRWDEDRGHAPQSSASRTQDHAGTRSFDPNNEALPAALIR